MNRLRLLLLFILLTPVLVTAQDDAIHITDGYVRGLPPGVANTAAYMRIANDSDTDKVLVGGSTPIADSVSIHATVNDSGMMRMEHQMQLVIPAGETVVLETGGLHLMLMGLKGSVGNEAVELTLNFQDGSTKSLLLPVISVLDEVP